MKIIEQHISCPNCPSSDAYCIYEDGHGYCFSCKTYTKGDSNISLNFDDRSFSFEYLSRRGISRESFEFYGVKTKVDKDGKPVSVGYPYDGGAYKVRLLDKKEFYSIGDIAKAGLFGKDKFAAGSHKYITVTEGEDDAISLYQVLRNPVCSVQSASTALRDCSVDRAYLQSFEKIYLCFDNDSAGRTAVAEVARLFDPDRVFQVKFSNRKDANEYLQHGEAEELRNIWWNSKRYLPENLIATLDEFDKILDKEPQWGTPYPFETLTEMTYGIRPGESVLITAQEGVGKTEIMHAIEHKILTETEANVGAIFLEELPQRHLQAIAGCQLRRPVHLPDTGIGADQIRSALREVVQKDDRLHLYCNFGNVDTAILLDTIRFLVSGRRCSYILLDHITMVHSGLEGTVDERRAIDYLATKLESLVKELNFALIMVSHVNDAGQTRGSRYTSKICDLRIDMERDITNPDPEIRNVTILTISKNRYGMKTGPAGKIKFLQDKYSFEEIRETENDGHSDYPQPQHGNDNIPDRERRAVA